MLVNTAGHTNFSLEFGHIFGERVFENGAPDVISTLFDFEEKIFTCFSFGNQISIYEGINELKTFKLTENDEQEILAVKFDQSNEVLRVVSRNGS